MSKVTAIVLTAVVCATAAVTAQEGKRNPYRNYTEEKFVDNMQSGGRNYVAVNDFISKADFASAKAQLTRAREQFAVTVQFWRDVNQKDDAIKMLRGVLTGMDDLDKTLSTEPVDAAAVKATLQRIGSGCQSCHAVYREQDAATKRFRVKQAALK